MTGRPVCPPGAVALSVLAIAACGAYRGPTPTPVQPGDVPSLQDVVTGTCRSIDADAGTFELITGIGHALRVERFTVDVMSQVIIDGRQSSLSRLQDATIVRVAYRTTPEGYVAEVVQSVRLEPEGGDR